MPGVQVGDAADEDDGAPWHDQTLPLAERMKLAEGRPLRRRMMAAMGQQDCGQCGYDCKEYADALFGKKEERLNLCVPGGKETARMLKSAACRDRLGAGARRRKGAAAAAAGRSPRANAGTLARQSSRGDLRVARAAQQAGLRERDLAHRVRPDRKRARLSRSAMPSGCYPPNDPALVDAVLKALDAPPDFPIGGRTLARGADRRRVAVARARHAVPAVLLHHRRRAPEEGARRWPPARIPTATPRRSTCWRRSRNSPACGPIPEAFIEALDPLQPRLYSISSSPKVHTRPRVAHRRHGALRHRQAQAPRRRLDLPRRPRRAGRQAQGLCAEGACASACRPIPPCRSS